MDFTKTENYEAIEDLAMQIFKDQVDDDYHKSGAGAANSASHLHAESSLEGETLYDRSIWQILAEAGLLGAAIGEDLGGSGMNLLEITPVLEAQGTVLLRLPLWSSIVAARTLEQYAAPELAKLLVVPFVTGGGHLAVALNDSRRKALSTPMKLEGGALSGSCHDVAYAEEATAVLLPAIDSDGNTSIVALDPTIDGVELEAATSSNGEPHFTVHANNVSVNADRIVGGRGEGAAIEEFMLQHSYTLLSALQLGVVQEGLRRTAEYVTERHQFGKPIASFQAVMHRCADGYIDREALRSCMWQAAWRLGEGLDASGESRAAKWWASEAGHRIGHTGQHLHGGIGSDVDYPIHRYFLWATQVQYTLGGGNEQLAELGSLLARDDAIGATL